jgi:hypothetical protein
MLRLVSTGPVTFFWRLWGGSNAGVDGMVSVISHELEETNTDPNLNAWYDASAVQVSGFQ